MDSKIRIEKMKPSGRRFYLTISGLEKPLPVTEELVYKFKLKEGIVITVSQLGQLQSESERVEGDLLVARFLAMREHSVGELKSKLTRRQFSPEIIAEILKKYIDMGLVDDARYAVKAVQQAIEKNPSGRSYLVALLQRKMISRDLAEKTVDKVLAGHNEEELATASLQKRWRLFGQFELERARQKAYNYLSRRGIGYTAAKAAFEKLYKLENKAGED